MNPLFASGLFDNPWIILVIFIITALSSWFSKHRAEKEAKDDAPPVSPRKPPRAPREFDLEQAMRQLLGEELPAKVPAPPPIPALTRNSDWQVEEPAPQMRRTVPPLPPLQVTLAPARAVSMTESEEETEDARRPAPLSGSGHAPPGVVLHKRDRHPRAGNYLPYQWRDPRSARQAFVASLVFGPPKGLEP